MQQPQVANTSDGFFDIVLEEVSVSLNEGTVFAPGVIERTFGAGHARAADRFLESITAHGAVPRVRERVTGSSS